METKPGILGPVLSDLRSYRESRATIRPVQGNAFLEQEEFAFFPTSKLGGKLTIGNEFIYSLRSALLYWNLLPVRYKALTITGEGSTRSGPLPTTQANSWLRDLNRGNTRSTYPGPKKRQHFGSVARGPWNTSNKSS